MITDLNIGDEVTLYPISEMGLDILRKEGTIWKASLKSKNGIFITLESMSGIRRRFYMENDYHFDIIKNRGEEPI